MVAPKVAVILVGTSSQDHRSLVQRRRQQVLRAPADVV
jgi:hypothetical protein